MDTNTGYFRRYTIVFVLTVAVLGIPCLVNFVFLFRSDEISPYSTIIEEQLARKGVYGSAYNGNDLKYKVELVRQVKPEIVVIGSSRAMNVRDLAFTRPFVNCGGVSSNLLESETFVKEMLKVHVPKVALYFIDYWWFNPRSEQISNRYKIDETARSFAKLFPPLEWIQSNKLPWRLYQDVILHGRYENEFTSFENYGLFAIRYSSGFRTDGSYFNSRSVQQSEGVVRYYWNEIKQTEKGQNERVNLGLGDFVKEEYVEWYLRTLDRLKEKGVKVIVVLSPVAPLHLKTIRSHAKEPYVTPLVRRLEKDVSPLYDFTDFESSGAGDCEYLDAYHIGDTASLRLLRAILQRDPNSPLKPYIDKEKLDGYISRFAGRVIILDQPEKYKMREYDFLGLGCRKGDARMAGQNPGLHMSFNAQGGMR
jgi:hypothetical protein